MNLLTLIRERITSHPTTRLDPIFGDIELIGPALWRTCQPVPLLPGMEGISITIEAPTATAAPDPSAYAAFEELSRRYEGLKASIGPMICKAAPRVRAKCLWEHAWLASVEIWRDPTTKSPVFALEYQLDDDPEYAYIIRLENWQPLDILVTG